MDKETLSLRAAAFFRILDANADGVLSKEEVKQALTVLQMPNVRGQITELFQRIDSNKDGVISMQEFKDYVFERERELRAVFDSIDQNHDGLLDENEVLDSIEKLDIVKEHTQSAKEVAHHLLEQMDLNHTGTISFDEWLNFLVLFPTNHVESIFNYWQLSATMDIGDGMALANQTGTELPQEIKGKMGGVFHHLLAGGLAGAISRTTTAPIDRLKTLIVVQGPGKKMGIIQGFSSMLRDGGVRSLWRGNGVNVIKIAPESAVKFMAFDKIKQMISKDINNPTTVDRLVSGSLAGALSNVIIYPLEVMKTRLATAPTGTYRGIWHAARTIRATEGYRAFYRGLAPTLLGIMPYAGIDLTVYETLKNLYIKRHPEREPTTPILLACGMISCTSGMMASYPLGLVRTQLQTGRAATIGADSKGASTSTTTSSTSIPPRSQTALSLLKSIWQTDGIRGLYRGAVPSMMKVIPAASISYLVYEYSKQMLFR